MDEVRIIPNQNKLLDLSGNLLRVAYNPSNKYTYILICTPAESDPYVPAASIYLTLTAGWRKDLVEALMIPGETYNAKE